MDINTRHGHVNRHDTRQGHGHFGGLFSNVDRQCFGLACNLGLDPPSESGSRCLKKFIALLKNDHIEMQINIFKISDSALFKNIFEK
jgi:hypothetical protein